MAETPEQYARRIRTTLGDKEPLTILQATPTKLAALVSGKSEDQLRKRPAPAKWSVAEILAHLTEAEMVIGFRVRLILGSDGVPIQAFDQDQWAKRYGNTATAVSLDLHRAIRQANVELYRSLSPEQWKQFGMHSERGKETVADILTLQAGHDVNHLKRIEDTLGAK
jgi:uncharacterized damage-inducible protein DinB